MSGVWGVYCECYCCITAKWQWCNGAILYSLIFIWYTDIPGREWVDKIHMIIPCAVKCMTSALVNIDGCMEYYWQYCIWWHTDWWLQDQWTQVYWQWVMAYMYDTSHAICIQFYLIWLWYQLLEDSYNPSLVQIMTCCLIGTKPLSNQCIYQHMLFEVATQSLVQSHCSINANEVTLKDMGNTSQNQTTTKQHKAFF